MRKILVVALISLIGILPMTAYAQSGKAQESASKVDYYPFVLGVGALGGVTVFNLLTGGWAAIPFATSSIELSSLWEGSLAINRFVTVGSAVAGLWAANWAYYNVNFGK